MSGWRQLAVRDLGRVVTGKTPPTGSAEYFEGGDELFVSPKDLSRSSYYVDKTETRITERALQKFKGQVIPRNTVMFTSLSFAFGKMGIAAQRCMTNQQINSVVVDAEHDFKFVYYLLRAYESIIFSFNSGIDTPIVPKSVFESIQINVPADRVAEEKIAAILSAYDDLIANNQRRIALLESMAEEIYREWFVRNRPAGAETAEARRVVQERWTTRTLPEVASITYGFPFAGERFNTAAVGKPIVRIRDVLVGRTDDYTDEVANDKYLVRAGDLLIGMDGEFHMNHWVGDEAYLVQRVCRVEARDAHLRAYLSHALRVPVRYFQETIVGATVGHLGAKHLNSIQIVVPDTGFQPNLERLNELLDLKLALAKQSLALSRSRDALLPRLISGKLKVDHLDIQLPPSMREKVTA